MVHTKSDDMEDSDRPRQVNSTLFGLELASKMGDIVRFCSTFLTSALASLILSGCLFIPIPIGIVHSPTGAVTSRQEALPSTPDGELAAKKKHQESAKKRQERAECKEQAEKLYSDADMRAYTKEYMSEER